MVTKVSGASEATSVAFESTSAGLDTDKTTCERTSPSPASSVESLDTAVDLSCAPANHKEREETKESGETPVRRDTPWDQPASESSFSGLEMVLGLLRGWEYRPVRSRRGSKLPVLDKAKLEQTLLPPLSVLPRSPCGGATDYGLYPHQPVPEVVTPCPQQELQAELAEMEEQWLDDYIQCKPFRFQQVDQQQERKVPGEAAVVTFLRIFPQFPLNCEKLKLCSFSFYPKKQKTNSLKCRHFHSKKKGYLFSWEKMLFVISPSCFFSRITF